MYNNLGSLHHYNVVRAENEAGTDPPSLFRRKQSKYWIFFLGATIQILDILSGGYKILYHLGGPWTFGGTWVSEQ